MNIGDANYSNANLSIIKTNATSAVIAKKTTNTPNSGTCSISYEPINLTTAFNFAITWTISINENVQPTAYDNLQWDGTNNYWYLENGYYDLNENGTTETNEKVRWIVKLQEDVLGTPTVPTMTGVKATDFQSGEKFILVSQYALDAGTGMSGLIWKGFPNSINNVSYASDSNVVRNAIINVAPTVYHLTVNNYSDLVKRTFTQTTGWGLSTVEGNTGDSLWALSCNETETIRGPIVDEGSSSLINPNYAPGRSGRYGELVYSFTNNANLSNYFLRNATGDANSEPAVVVAAEWELNGEIADQNGGAITTYVLPAFKIAI